MPTPSLAEKIKELRSLLGISLRELARRAEISAPHMSDIELGRRFPSDEVLGRLAEQLNVSKLELGQLDNRDSLGDLRRMMIGNPAWGAAFRTLHDEAKGSEGLTPDELIRRITERKTD